MKAIIPKQTKAEKAAIILANNAIKKTNDFYSYHKEVIDQHYKLAGEARELSHRVQMIKINRINRGDFDKPF